MLLLLIVIEFTIDYFIMQLCLVAFLCIGICVYVRTVDGTAVANIIYVFIVFRVVSVRGTRWYIQKDITLRSPICNGR